MKNKKLLGKIVLVSALGAACSAAHANPTIPVVVNGTVSIAQPNAQTLNITNSPGSIINWHGFSIGTGESTRFIQQNGASAVLNRVTGADPSSILGTLISNGRVFLVNPNGIVFGGGSMVDVQGLIASTRDISNANFLGGKYLFENGGANSITMQTGAQITTATAGNGGQVWLIANNINLENASRITAPQGQVTLAAGTRVQVGESALGNMTFSVTTNSTNTLKSMGNVTAESGAVNLFAEHIVHTGTLDVSGSTQGGTIKLLGNMQTGSVNVSGTLDASASVPSPNGGGLGRGSSGEGIGAHNGGFIETSAAHVTVADTARVTTSAPQGKSGIWLIDPFDFTIAAMGGNITGATLSSNLGGGNVSILSSNGTVGTAGDVNVNDAVAWSANKLTLNAQNNININANLNGSGSASLALEYGQGAVAAGNLSDYIVHAAVNLPAGNNFSTKLGSNGVAKNYTVITSLGAAGSVTATDLQGMGGNLAGNYALGSNIDAAATSAWNAGAGFVPVGSTASQFTGIFDGLGHSISSLNINSVGDYVGFFGINAGALKNISLDNVNIIGSGVGERFIGSLAGGNLSVGTITSVNATGSIAASGIYNVGHNLQIGGLAGYSNGIIRTSSSSASMMAPACGGCGSEYIAGGLVGSNSGTISSSQASGTVLSDTSGGGNVGGLAGRNNGVISESFATGAVTGRSIIGGLVGWNAGGTIRNSYATGAVTGGYAGGLVELLDVGGLVENSYSTGAVTGVNVGGLVNRIGWGGGTITNSHWDTQTSGTTVSAGGTGLTTANAMLASSYTGWDFTNTWVNVDGSTRPTLRNTSTSAPVPPPPPPPPDPTPIPPPADSLNSASSTTLPTGAKIQNGQVLFQFLADNPRYLKITNTPGAVIDWNTYSISLDATVKYAQQDQYSAVLNRVVTAYPSVIEGTLRSNGRVFLMNPNGITFGQGATLDVQGLIASTLNLSTANFLAGNYGSLSQSPQANVTSQYGYTGNILGLKNGQQSWLTTGNEVEGFFPIAPYGQINGKTINGITNNLNNQTIPLPAFIDAGTGTINASTASTLKSRMYDVSDPHYGMVDANHLLSIVGGQYRDNVLQQAQLSEAVYEAKDSPPPPTGWIKKDSFQNPSDGFKAAAYFRPVDSRMSIVYAGTKFTSIADLTQDAFLFLSNYAVTSHLAQYADALNVYGMIKNSWVGAINSLEISGHSLGGNLAQYVGAHTGVMTNTFNAPGFRTVDTSIFGDSAYDYLAKLANTNHAQIVNHVLSQDWVGNIPTHVGQMVNIKSGLTFPPVFVDMPNSHSMKYVVLELKAGNYGHLSGESYYGPLAAISDQSISNTIGGAAQLAVVGLQATSNLEQTYLLNPYMAAINAAGNVGGNLIIKADNLVNSLISLFTSSPQPQASSPSVNTFSNLTTANSTPAMLPVAGNNSNFLYDATPQNTTVQQVNGVYRLVQAGG